MAKILTAHQEYELCRRWQKHEDKAALAELVECHMPWVRHQAGKMFRQFSGTVEYEDLVQQGVIGLMKGVDKFDCRRDEYKLRLLTYAAWWIRNEMQVFAYQCWPVHVPTHILREVFSERFRKEKHTTKRMLAANNQTVLSLDYIVGQERTTDKRQERYKLRLDDPTFEAVDRTFIPNRYKAVFRELGPKKTRALFMYYGILDGFKYQYATIAGELNMTILEAQAFVHSAREQFKRVWKKHYAKAEKYLVT